jgi:hypothetical protein
VRGGGGGWFRVKLSTPIWPKQGLSAGGTACTPPPPTDPMHPHLPDCRSSAAPIRLKMRSHTVNCMDSAGTKLPTCAITASTADMRRNTLLPPMLGPVRVKGGQQLCWGIWSSEGRVPVPPIPFRHSPVPQSPQPCIPTPSPSPNKHVPPSPVTIAARVPSHARCTSLGTAPWGASARSSVGWRPPFTASCGAAPSSAKTGRTYPGEPATVAREHSASRCAAAVTARRQIAWCRAANSGEV